VARLESDGESLERVAARLKSGRESVERVAAWLESGPYGVRSVGGRLRCLWAGLQLAQVLPCGVRRVFGSLARQLQHFTSARP